MRHIIVVLALLMAGCTGLSATEPTQDSPLDDSEPEAAVPRVSVVTLAQGVHDVGLWLPGNAVKGAEWVRADSITDVYHSRHAMAGWLLELKTTSSVQHGSFALHLVHRGPSGLEVAATAAAPVGESARAWVAQADYEALVEPQWFVTAYAEGPAPDGAVQVSWQVAISHLPEVPDDAYTSFDT